MATENLADNKKFETILKDTDDSIIKQLQDIEKEIEVEVIIDYKTKQ